MSRRFITQEDVKAASADGVLELGADDQLTDAAEAAARRLGVSIHRASPTDASPVRAPRPVPSIATPAMTTKAGPHAVVSVIGRNRSHVLAEITTRVAELDGNVMDISQTIVSGYFSTLLIVDLSDLRSDFKTFKDGLEQLTRDGDYRLSVQHEDVFRAMHRI